MTPTELKSPAEPSEVALVSMPWAPPNEPCLGLAILKAALTRAGVSCRVQHAGPELLKFIEEDTYQFLAEAWGLNEFLFTALLDEDFDEAQMRAVTGRVLHQWRRGRRLVKFSTPEAILDLLQTMRHQVMPALVEDTADWVIATGARVVGFTCLFDQTMASLAVAHALKSRDPELTIILGGYALEGDAGPDVARAFPDVNYVVQGDGEQLIVDLALAARRGAGSGGALPDFPTRVIHAQKYNLNESPTPDYSDWFAQLAALRAATGLQVNTAVLPVESSRGCWWGQSMHCVFCGIDDDTLKYRFKAPERTVAMLEDLRARHGDYVFRFSDYIMPKAYYTELLPHLAARPDKFRLHTEIKANQPQARVQLLADAGYVAIQPGVESFSTPVLRAMRKGVRGIDNVILLKHAYQAQLGVYYNVLYGLPDDQPQDYEAVVERLPRLYHLMPPSARTETIVTRFAPLQTDFQRFNLQDQPVHHECYDTWFSQDFLARSGFSLDEYAYYFKRNFSYSPVLSQLYLELVMQIDHWKALHRGGFVELSYERGADGTLTVTDTRYGPHPPYALSAAASTLYEA